MNLPSFLQFLFLFSYHLEAMAYATKQLTHNVYLNSHVPLSSPLVASRTLVFLGLDAKRIFKINEVSASVHRSLTAVAKLSTENDGIVPGGDDPEDGVSLGTMKLPLDVNIPRFEVLLFQWANSLCQGANLPLPMPLKVDKIPGGARLGFITIGDGKTEVNVYIDCLVFPPSGGSGPIFRAIINGPLKDQSPPGEPRIMRSLLQALKKSVEIA